MLEAALAAEGVPSVEGPVSAKLSTQENQVLGILLRKYPNYVSQQTLMERVMPNSYYKQITVVVCNIRKKLQHEAILTYRDSYRLGDILIGDVQ